MKTKNLFQFLLVRLKGRTSCSHKWVVEFQFLLVRLKVCNEMDIYSVNVEFQFLLVRLKGDERKEEVMRLHTFQFLLVRLKGGSLVAYCLYITFQFLLVRLKDYKSLQKMCRWLRNFNSFWYD